MPFGTNLKTEMFIKCGRLCCLCLKQCGTNIEVAHIVDESDGGPNEFDNGIPVCFDCHQEIGAYNKKHPKGNKFQPKELKARRDRIFHLVESGLIYSQIIANRSRDVSDSTIMPELKIDDVRQQPSKETKQFLSLLLSDGSLPPALPQKLSLLNSEDRAFVIDTLLSELSPSFKSISPIAQIVQSPGFPKDQSMLIVEQMVRIITLCGTCEAKALLLNEISKDLLVSLSEDLRTAFFEDIIAIVQRDQYSEVNVIGPALVAHTSSIPSSLYQRFVFALLDQASSDSYRGAPSARQMLATLPEPMARAAIVAIDKKYLCWHALRESVTLFIRQYRIFARMDKKELFDDFLNLTYRQFVSKYYEED